MADGQLRNDANAYCHWRNATLPTEVAIDAFGLLFAFVGCQFKRGIRG